MCDACKNRRRELLSRLDNETEAAIEAEIACAIESYAETEEAGKRIDAKVQEEKDEALEKSRAAVRKFATIVGEVSISPTTSLRDLQARVDAFSRLDAGLTELRAALEMTA